MAYPILNNDPEIFKNKTKDEENKDLRYWSEKHDEETIL